MTPAATPGAKERGLDESVASAVPPSLELSTSSMDLCSPLQVGG